MSTCQGRLVKMEDGLYVCHDADFKGEMEYLKAKVDAGTALKGCGTPCLNDFGLTSSARCGYHHHSNDL